MTTKPLDGQGSVNYTKWLIPHTFTKPFCLLTQKEIFQEQTWRMYVSCLVVIGWFIFIFPWGSFWSFPNLVWLEELPFHDTDFAQRAITRTRKLRVHENGPKWIDFKSLTKLKDQSPELVIQIKNL